MVNNLTEGRPLRLLFFSAMPMVVGNLFQQLYNMVDSMVVGRFVRENALAAIGSSFPTISLSVAIATGMSMGCTVIISQFFGVGKILEMKVTVSTALIPLRVIRLIIIGIEKVVTGPLLTLLGIDSDITADSLAYLEIYFEGAIFLFLYNSLNDIYNALDDSQTSLKLLMVSTLTNIVLDLLFVTQFNMGVTGVAWATLIAQGMCAVFSFFVLITRLRKLENEEVSRGKVSTFFDGPSAERITKVGVPPILQQSIVSTSMVLMQGLVSSYGKVFVAGYTATAKIDTLAMMPNMNFSNAMSSYVAQNIGARRMDRVKQGYKVSTFTVVVFSLIITNIILPFGPQFLGLSLEQGSEGGAMSYGLSYMRTVSVFCILMGALFISNSLLRGAGDMGTFVLSSVINLFSRVVIAYLLAHFVSSNAIWWSIPTGWAIGALFSFLRVRSGEWIAKRLVD